MNIISHTKRSREEKEERRQPNEREKCEKLLAKASNCDDDNAEIKKNEGIPCGVK